MEESRKLSILPGSPLSDHLELHSRSGGRYQLLYQEICRKIGEAPASASTKALLFKILRKVRLGYRQGRSFRGAMATLVDVGRHIIWIYRRDQHLTHPRVYSPCPLPQLTFTSSDSRRAQGSLTRKMADAGAYPIPTISNTTHELCKRS